MHKRNGESLGILWVWIQYRPCDGDGIERDGFLAVARREKLIPSFLMTIVAYGQEARSRHGDIGALAFRNAGNAGTSGKSGFPPKNNLLFSNVLKMLIILIL